MLGRTTAMLIRAVVRVASLLLQVILPSVSYYADGIDCPLLIEPECSIDVPPIHSTIDLDKV